MESQQKKTVYLICFSEQTIIPIWEPDAPEWQSTAKRKVITEPFHNIENAPFRTKFDKDVNEMRGNLGIGCISDFEPQH